MKNKKSKMSKNKSYEGLQNKIRSMKTPKIDVWTNQYADRDYTIDLEFPEFTCICPKTALPDFANIKISYIPDKKCLELKSLKMYFIFYRDVGIFHEHVTNKILDDIVKAARPRWAKVDVIMNTRGGISTSVTAEFK